MRMKMSSKSNYSQKQKSKATSKVFQEVFSDEK